MSDSADDQRYELRFSVQRAGAQFSAAVQLPVEMAAAVTNAPGEDPAQTQVCADQWFIQELVQERGGSLVIGELVDGQLRLSVRGYDSGDEETMHIVWGRGEPVLVSSTGKAVALAELPTVPLPTSAQAGMPPGMKTLECALQEPGNAHFLTLRVGAQGRLQGLSYTAATPGGNCAVDADREDGATTWRDAADATTITWPDGRTDEPDSASSLRVTREGDGYALNMAHLLPGSFCGQSAQTAGFIDLMPGSGRCTVQERESEPGND
ncbi:hypothetical protein [Comamonas flocculans]|uniref:Uncharacterized protein n=1 Tax=Comamonas flocculans TaxID=2597701 RepID=A0A5B8RW37_9BURK|nr:hypothetical protein [Comamonas flocculans]QEA12948.1 hypothetical protein FOZ74_07860 [Comamonas flocculans]